MYPVPSCRRRHVSRSSSPTSCGPYLEISTQEKGKNILTGPPMNLPPSSSSSPFGGLRGCEGDGCASAPDTWPLLKVLRRGVPCRLCCSCILLSHRSLFCCRCFFLVSSSYSNYDSGDELMAPPAPTVTCQVCREAVAHVPCLYPAAADGVFVFVCPPCGAAQSGRPFTYAPPCGQPLDERQGRVLVLAARVAMALTKRHEAAARADAERKALVAREARTRARDALSVAFDLAAAQDPSWVLPPPPENDELVAPEEEDDDDDDDDGEDVADVGEVLLVRRTRNTMALAPLPLATLTIGTAASSVVPMAMAMAPGEATKHTPSPSQQSKQLFGLDEDVVESDAKAANPEPKRQRAALNSFDVKEVAMAAAEAARASPPTPKTLRLFPGAKVSSSSTKRPRTLQLLDDDDDDDEEEEM